MRIFSLFFLLLLSGCSSVGGDASSLVKLVRQSWQDAPMPNFSTGLNPKYRYLWLHVTDRSPVVLALGFEEVTPNGLLETWYSNDNAFVQTINGRLAAVRGLRYEWTSVRWLGQPVLSDAAAPAVVRTRDVFPSYAFGVTDQLFAQTVSFSQVPAQVLPRVGESPYWSEYAWIKETARTHPVAQALPDAWFAVGVHRGLRSTVAGFQCMAADFCLSFARWPLEPVRKL